MNNENENDDDDEGRDRDKWRGEGLIDRSEGKVGRRGSAAGNADVTASIPMS